jgi:hypothetical protein
MRTTLTLDDDVAALLTQLQEQRKATLKEVVNEALRKGLLELERPPKPRELFRTETFETGKCALPNMECVSEVLDWLDNQDEK